MNRKQMPKKILQNNWPSWYEQNTDAQEECNKITDNHDMNGTLMPKKMLQNNWPNDLNRTLMPKKMLQNNWPSWYEQITDAQEDVTE